MPPPRLLPFVVVLLLLSGALFAAPTISNSSSLATGVVGIAYSQTFAATGGTSPYTWSASGGTVPTGLTLSSGGVLSGTPTASGTFSFTIQVADNTSATATKTFSITIYLVLAANGIGIPSPSDTTTSSVVDGTATVQVPAGMVYIPAGSFTYGPSTTTPVVAATTVTLNGYCIGRFHVTNAEFYAFIQDTGYTQYIPSTGTSSTAYWVNGTYPVGKGNHPVNFVSLSAAKAYAAWVSKKTGFNVIIPTAYQWEKAARGPNAYKYPWGNSAGATYSNGVLTSNFNFNANITSYYLTTLHTPYSLTPSWTSDSTVTFSNSSSPYYNNPPSTYYPSPMTVSSIVAISNAATPVATALVISSSGAVAGYVDHNTDTGLIYTDLFAAINNAGGYTTPEGSYPSGVSSYGAYDMAGNLWNWTTTLFIAANGAEANATVNMVRGGSWYATSSSAVSVDSGEGRSDGDYNSVGFRVAMILPATTNNLAVTSTTLTSGVVNASYSQALSATGGTAPYNWSVSSGTLPIGLSLTTDGVLSGTPTTLGTSTFTVQVGDSGGLIATQSVSVAVANALAITSTSPLAAGSVGTAYSQTLGASGGTSPYTWGVTGGTVPTSLVLNAGGVLSGTPSVSGTFNFTTRVTDGASSTATASFTVVIAASALAITSNSPLSSGSTTGGYSQTLTASGGTPPYTWTLSSGTLPTGLTLASSGVLSGTPTAAGSFTFTPQVADSGGLTATKAFTATIISPLTISSTPPLSSGVIGTAYSATITASGGTGTGYAWKVTNGLLPNGVSLSSGGVLSGTPTVAGAFSVTVQVADSANTTAAKTFSLTVATFGVLDHLAWDYVPASTNAGTAFAVHLTARDAVGNLITSFNGTASISAASGTGLPTPVVITEVTPASENQIELQNVSNATANTTGWFMRIGDSTTNSVTGLNTPNATTYSLPTSLAAGQLLRISESTSTASGRVYFGSSIGWMNTPSNRRGWVALFDNTNTLRDFFAFGWTTSDLSSFTITVNSQAITLGSQWSGAGTTSSGSVAGQTYDSFQRTGTSDNNSTVDWAWKHNADNSDATSFGVTNAGLTVPWVGTTSLAVSPTNVTFVEGEFLGYLTIATAANNVTLTANDGASHTVTTGFFSVGAALVSTAGDGIPDSWKTAHGFSATANIAALDSDGDGQSNLSEYLAGTDPQSAASVFKVGSFAIPLSGQFTISWPAVGGKLYRVVTSSDLTTWTPLTSILPSTSGTQSITMDTGGATSLFVRVEIVPVQ